VFGLKGVAASPRFVRVTGGRVPWLDTEYRAPPTLPPSRSGYQDVLDIQA